MTDEIIVRYAESDNDTIWIHQFLLIVAAPMMPGPVDGVKSIQEVWRVCANKDPNEPSFALMALKDERLVGTLGIIAPVFWWSREQRFMVNRWFFALPGFGAGRLLLKEATRCAKSLDLELQIYSEERGSLTIINKSPKRKSSTDVFRLLTATTADAADVADDNASIVADGGSTEQS